MAKIAVVYGRDQSACDVVVSVIKKLGHEPKLFDDAKASVQGRRFNSSIVDTLFKGVDAAVIVLSPDEESRLRMQLCMNKEDTVHKATVRPIVLIEYGMAVAILGEKTIEVTFQFPHSNIPSDFMGINPIQYVDTESLASDLGRRLKELGLDLPGSEKQSLLAYVAPEPPFEDAEPPYEFIGFPFDLPEEHQSPQLLEEKEKYERMGYEIKSFHESTVSQAEAQGWRPYVTKRVSRRDYARTFYKVMNSDQVVNFFMVRKKD